ncbi:MAG: hypothetical protein GEV11_07535 [Streptosporangiales bacterium]|nr:hypothetical protein [Streptosporangiales bacterium]
MAAVEAFLRVLAPSRTARLRDELGVLATAYPGSRPDPERRLVDEAEDLLAFLEGYGPGAAGVLRHARILCRAADLVTRPRRHRDPERTVFAARDRYMAEAVDRLLEDPRAKVVLWAHNGHIAKARHGSALAMGEHLRARYGDAYYALGLMFGEGSFRAHRVRPGPWPGRGSRRPEANHVGPPPAASVEARLAAATAVDHLVDLRAVDEAPEEVRRWAYGPHPTRSYGAQVARRSYRFNTTPCEPAREFDGLAYVTWTSATLDLEAARAG